jgi:hypothetical protein
MLEVEVFLKLTKKWLYEDECHGKLLKAPK